MRARAIRVGTVVAAVVAVLAARDGDAQTSGVARPLFVGASVAANIDNSVWAPSGADRTGGTVAIGFAAGFNFADRWSLQVEGEWPTSERTVVIQYPTGYPYGYPYGYQSYSSVTRASYRTPTVAVLFGVHIRPSKRVDVALQFGPSLRGERRDYGDQSLVNGAVTEWHQDTWTDWHLRVSAGGEVAVAVTPRVAVVGQLRVHLAYLDEVSYGVVTRPAIGVRVRF